MDYKEKYEALLANIKAYHARFGDTCNLKKELEECVPELRESEDERIREAIIKTIKRAVTVGSLALDELDKAGISWRDAVAYLEKLKERERIIQEREVTDIELDLHEIIAQAMSDKRLADEDVLEQFEREAALSLTWAAEKQFRRDGKLKEQEPVGWTDADEKILKRIIERLRFVIPVPGEGLVGVTFKHSEDAEAINWLKRRVTSQPQPKQEWSEEEVDAMVKVFSDNLPLCGEFQSYHDALVHTYRQGVLAALKAIRPQPKQERTEEDEKNWGQIFACISDDALKEWLEKQKAKIIADLAQTAPWSDEDAVGLDRARDILRSCRGQVPGYESDDGISEHDDAIRTLERIRPARPHWRPSEEQMKALQNAVALAARHEALVELYDDLKKL